MANDTDRTETVTYDPLNRIASALSQATSGSDCWGQGFTIDGLANLYGISSQQCSSGTLSAGVNSNNQLTNTGYSYDLAGNMTAEGSSYSYSFDAENRLTTASGGGVSGGPYTYVYDGNSLRVKKSNSGGGTLYWRSLSGDAIAETDLNGDTTNEYVFFAGRRIARIDSSGNVFFYYADHLGTTRSITNSSGTTCYDADFTPYGQEVVHTNNCPQNYKFTGYERDTETGLDYAMFRYYNPRLGRFMSADPLGGDLADPQSQDGYAYVRNSTTALVDPLGLRMNPIYFNDINPVANITSFTYWGIDTRNYDGLGTFLAPGGAAAIEAGTEWSGPALPGIVTPGPISEPGDGPGGNSGGVHNKWGGTFNCNVNAGQVLNYLENNFGSLASTVVTVGPTVNAVTFSAPGGITPGATVNASVLTAAGPYVFSPPLANAQLTVTSVGSGGFVMQPDPKLSPLNGTLSFTAANAPNGQISFAVNADAAYSSIFARALSTLGKSLENGIWNNLVNKIKTYCNKK